MHTYLLILSDKAPNGQHTATVWTLQAENRAAALAAFDKWIEQGHIAPPYKMYDRVVVLAWHAEFVPDCTGPQPNGITIRADGSI